MARWLETYVHGTGLLHRLPAWVKLLAALAFNLGVVLLPWEAGRSGASAGSGSATAWWWLAGLGALLAALMLLGRVSFGYALRRAVMLEPFVLGVCLLALFGPGGARAFLFLLARSTLCLWSVVLLTTTTPFSELLLVLRRVGVPSLLVTTLMLMYRYLFVLTNEARRMQKARAARTFTPTRRLTWQTMAGVAGQLFLRASARAERIYLAMCARGWR